MYIAISLKKVVESKEEANILFDRVREKVSNLEGVEATALFVDDLTNPATTPNPNKNDQGENQ